MKGYEVKERSENFRVFESKRTMSYDMDEFLNLCESMLKKGFDYIGEYQGNIIFKKFLFVEKSETEVKEQ